MKNNQASDNTEYPTPPENVMQRIAPWANWIAQNSDGQWWAFETLPTVEIDEQTESTNPLEWWSPPELTKFAMVYEGEVNADWKRSLRQIDRTSHCSTNSATEN